VLVVRPQPGQLVTCGMKLRIDSDWENLLRGLYFFSSVAVRLGGQADADGVADSCEQAAARGLPLRR